MKSQAEINVHDVLLEDIYNSVIDRAEELNKVLKEKTTRNTIRGELNRHEANSNDKNSLKLFERVGRGLYTLTDNARNYSGR